MTEPPRWRDDESILGDLLKGIGPPEALPASLRDRQRRRIEELTDEAPRKSAMLDRLYVAGVLAAIAAVVTMTLLWGPESPMKDIRAEEASPSVTDNRADQTELGRTVHDLGARGESDESLPRAADLTTSLAPSLAHLDFDESTPGTVVWLDGRDAGTTPLGPVSVRPGLRRYVLRAPSWAVRRGQVTAKAGEVATVPALTDWPTRSEARALAALPDFTTLGEVPARSSGSRHDFHLHVGVGADRSLRDEGVVDATVTENTGVLRLSRSSDRRLVVRGIAEGTATVELQREHEGAAWLHVYVTGGAYPLRPEPVPIAVPVGVAQVLVADGDFFEIHNGAEALEVHILRNGNLELKGRFEGSASMTVFGEDSATTYSVTITDGPP